MKKGEDYIGISVVYFCHDGEGNFVFNKRSVNCRDEQGKWDIGGGGVDFGDSLEQTLRKEIREEYCTDILDFEFLGYRDVFRENNGKKTHWLAMDFKVLVDKNKVANGEPHKFDAVEWFRLDNLPSPIHSQLMNTINKNRKKLGLK
jgi:8-oxo-dGTP pyrophosphatase MutT (NUDIX family)